MSESRFANHAEQHLNQQPVKAAPASNVPKDVPLRFFAPELSISQGFTAYPYFLNNAVLDWLTQEGYLLAQSSGNRITPKGAACGLGTGQTTTADGKPYFVITCGEPVKALLRDNVARIIALEREGWEPMLACLTPEWHSRTVVSEEAVSLTDMVKQIHSRLPADLPRKLEAQRINVWLVKNGLMENAALRKQKVRQPTAAGRKIGILFNLSQTGKSVRWSAPAQRFVWDNLNQIVQDLASGEAYRWGPQEVVLSADLRRRMRPVSKPVNLAYVEAVINKSLKDEEDHPNLLPRYLVASWLLHEQYTTYVKKPGGGGNSLPTKKGEAAGLVSLEGVLHLSEAGQQFIYDNLQQIFNYYQTL